MDRSGADEMVQRLQGLGYQPHLVPAQLNGQTWYKVRDWSLPDAGSCSRGAERDAREIQSIYTGAAFQPLPRDQASAIDIIDADWLFSIAMTDSVNRLGWANWRWRHRGVRLRAGFVIHRQNRFFRGPQAICPAALFVWGSGRDRRRRM